MNRPAHAFVFGLTLGLLSLASHAASLESKGQPEPNVAFMTSYGVDVATRSGLKTVVPAGWQLLIHRTAVLPETMSWKMGEPWPAVLTDFAAKNNVAILLDWEKRQVLIRTHELAIEESAKAQEIAQAAVTPLPRFDDAKTDSQLAKARAAHEAAEQRAALAQAAAEQQKVAAVEPSPATQVAKSPVIAAGPVAPAPAAVTASSDGAKVEHSAPAAVTRVPVIRVNPTPQMVAVQRAAALRAPARMESTAEFRYTGAVALNKPSVRTVAQAIANKYDLRMVYAAPEFRLKGPVTLLAESAEQDAHLLDKAIGVFGPVKLEVSLSEKVLRVVAKDPRYTFSTSVTFNAPAVPAPSASQASPILEAPDAAPAATTTAVASPAEEAVVPVPAPAKPLLTLVVGEQEPLESALVRFTREHGFTVEWKVDGGYEANRAMTFTGESVRDVLSSLLPKLGLSADIYTQQKHIVVRPGDAALDR